MSFALGKTVLLFCFLERNLPMCCVAVLLAFIGPRTALIYLYLTHYLDGIFQTALWPILGFCFMPFTTLGYAFAMHSGGLSGLGLLWVVLGVVCDVGLHGGTEHQRRSR
jgi:hypothetical protein